MALRIPIDHRKLTDSPYCESNKSFFSFSPTDTNDFVQDIINGNPTCYLISGYRGAGKSSFIKRLEADVRSKSNNSVFIHLNFAKHEARSILLRKLIRNFYLQLTSNTENKLLHDTLKKTESLKIPLAELQDLYERTFYEVSKNSNIKKVTKSSSLWKFDGNLKEIVLSISSLGAFAFLSLKLDLQKAVSYIPIFIAAATAILPFLQFFGFSKTKESGDEKTDEHSKNSFYDDEIAEYRIQEVLLSFQNHIRAAFVLDELDKINDDLLVDSVINELKPLMLSGLASFIVVAGQNLYYNYFFSQGKDDSPLSSLFSKVHHVSLLSSSELKIIFRKVIRLDPSSLSEDDSKLLEAYASYLVLVSRRVPRRFISLIRQNLIWANNEAFIDINKSGNELVVYSQLLQSVEKIQNQMIAAEGYPAAISDYISMQLLLKIDLIINH